MTAFGFHASHEQIPPSALLAAVQHAEQAGFDAAMSSDHFSPWSARQGQSAFAWSWLGAALQATTLPFGVVNAPGQRYHPAIIAQAIGTLASMYPGRFWAALGTGEASNEHITGTGWPRKEQRNARLLECVEIIRALLDGEEVSHDGLVRVDRARLWTRPAEPPPLIGAAVSVPTARWCASWADGLITVNAPVEHLRRMIDAYREAGGRGKLHLQMHLSWAADEAEAEAIALDQWRSNIFGPPACWDIDSAETFDAVSQDVTIDQVRRSVHISSDLGRHAGQLAGLRRPGFRRDRAAPRRAAAAGLDRRLRRRGAPPAAQDDGRCRMKLALTSDLWWKNAVVYCLDVETYADGNGDGCGDFRGLIQRIDHLDRLGVTCLWLMPFFPTQDRDDGYDITDFYGVDPRLGSVGDFVELMRTARDRGMRVIADLVVNHTSAAHPWFVEARSSRDSPKRDWYIWQDEPPANARGRRGVP